MGSGFSYASETNAEWLTPEDFKSLSKFKLLYLSKNRSFVSISNSFDCATVTTWLFRVKYVVAATFDIYDFNRRYIDLDREWALLYTSGTPLVF